MSDLIVYLPSHGYNDGEYMYVSWLAQICSVYDSDTDSFKLMDGSGALIPYVSDITSGYVRACSPTGSFDITTFDYTIDDTSIDTVVLGGNWGTSAGYSLPAKSVTDHSVYVHGKYIANPCYVGSSYSTSMQLTRPFVRDNTGASLLDANMILHYIVITHNHSGEYSVVVTSPNEPDWEDTFVPVESSGLSEQGEAQFFVRGHAKDTTVTITSESAMPCTLVAGEWICTVQARAT